MKKLIAIMMALVMCCSLVVSASAAKTYSGTGFEITIDVDGDWEDYGDGYYEFYAEDGTCLEIVVYYADELAEEGYTAKTAYDEFLDGYKKLRMASDKINICVHLIFGLPRENTEMMLETVRRVADLRPHQVKIHLLHVIKGTAMAEMYERGEYAPLEKDEYVDIVCRALELLPPETVIGRLTGDGMAEDLLAPMWSTKKVSVINDIDKRLFALDTCQGAKFKE